MIARLVPTLRLAALRRGRFVRPFSSKGGKDSPPSVVDPEVEAARLRQVEESIRRLRIRTPELEKKKDPYAAMQRAMKYKERRRREQEEKKDKT